MANESQVVLRKVEEGERFILLRASFQADGSGDVENIVLTDRKDHAPVVDGRMAIDKIFPSLSGFDVIFSFDNVVDQLAWVVTPMSEEQCFECWPVKDDANPVRSERILMSTNGMTAIGDVGALFIRIRKG